MGQLLAGLKDYAEDFSPAENESLMLVGNAGLGKTHAALAIAGIVLDKGCDVIYVSSPDFFGKMEASRFDPSGDADTLLRTAATADLLILDDLGTEFVTPYFITTFYSLLNNRPGGRPAYHCDDQYHRRFPAGKALHRENLQPPVRLCPVQLCGRRHPGAESQRVIPAQTPGQTRCRKPRRGKCKTCFGGVL